MAGATWTATKISATAAQNMQTEAGLLLNTFDVSDPDEPTDSEIICATSGDFSISCTPEVEDFFEDVNNAPNNTKEGKRITGWNCELSVECLEFTVETLELALGAADAISTTGVKPRAQYESNDFKTIWWIGDLVDKTKALVVKMGDAVSTGGISLSTTKKGKGRLSLTITPHVSLATPDVMPMEFYILEKAA